MNTTRSISAHRAQEDFDRYAAHLRHAIKNNRPMFAEYVGAQLARRLRRMHFATVYRIDRCYGGPEEGGWWYDWYQLESFEPTDSETGWLSTEAVAFGRFSMAHGHDIGVNIEALDSFGAYQSTERPHYE